MLQLSQELLFIAASIFIVKRLRAVLLWSNYLTIATFNLSLLGRSIMYSWLYWGLTDQGTRELYVKDNSSVEGDVAMLYRIRFANNLFDFVTVTEFYYLILKMSNLWDRILFDRLLSSLAETEATPNPEGARPDQDSKLSHE